MELHTTRMSSLPDTPFPMGSENQAPVRSVETEGSVHRHGKGRPEARSFPSPFHAAELTTETSVAARLRIRDASALANNPSGAPIRLAAWEVQTPRKRDQCEESISPRRPGDGKSHPRGGDGRIR